VFEDLIRTDLGFAKEFIDIGCIADHLKDEFELNKPHCVGLVL